LNAIRMRCEREDQSWLIRFFAGWSEVAYIKLGLSGLQAEIEFPSDWHERRAGWVRLGFGMFKVCFSFPWPWTVPDDYQCSGPTYGFNFFGDGLHLHWGKQHGKRDDPFTIIKMPWQWRHREHKVLSEPESHPYTYTLRSGEAQERTATIKVESRLWTRPWLPYKRLSRSINVEFSGEVGERSGSWKGGCIGCGYEMLPGESPFETLRRMERERTF
jgi:hypothetical protein